MKRLLLFLLLPFFGNAQEVKPILSQDYLSLIRKDTSQQSGKFYIDSTNNINKARLTVRQPFNGSVRKIKIRGDELYVLPTAPKTLLVGGSLTSTIELKSLTRLPSLQNQYVQGRAQNGTLIWNGPETDELFSYGPPINTLQYDGQAYAYDVNGRLVSKGTGTGPQGNAYASNIFRTGVLSSQSLFIQSKFLKRGQQLLSSSIQLGRSSEKLVIQENRNHSHSFKATVETQLSWLKISAAYEVNSNKYSNDNRTGFLNRVYQQALLTPISFSNKQGILIGANQRSYSHLADNPFFLLQKNQNNFSQLHQDGNLSFELRANKFSFKLMQSLERTHENNTEGLPSSSAYFSDGILVNRSKEDHHYLLRATASYSLDHGDSYFTSRFLFNYLLGDHGSNISYQPGYGYTFQRTSTDVAQNYEVNYRNSDVEAGLNLTNRFYASNTTKEKKFFLPGVSGFTSLRDVLGWDYSSIKLRGSYQRFASEIPIGVSFSQHNSLKIATADVLKYLPSTEAQGFDDLSLIQHEEWSMHLLLQYRRLTLDAGIFRHLTNNDVFPLVDNGVLKVQNLANHRNKGFEIEAGFYSYSRNFQTSHQLSFVTNHSEVLQVKAGYDYTAIAGFKNVHKALIEGKVLGAIVGNRYLRNSSGQIIIGTDGFPLVDQADGVIGNANPDFIMKTSNTLNWKNFFLSIDLEWKKGGDVWNGTQAVLDYYGRSKTSADLRNTTGYVFDGVTIDGHPNATPVSFYNSSLPIEKNRWVRYGYSGVAEDYIQKGDHLRINTLSLGYKLNSRKYIQSATFSLYANSLLLWTAYHGVDPNRLLFDAPNTSGLDFFNLPSTKAFGCQVSLQF